MDARGIRRARSEEEEESYFISMADMMVGLVFVFVVLLLYFALQYQQKSQAISNAGETRAQLLRDLRDDLAKHNLRVEIDTATGVLRIPAELLFASGQYRLSPEGHDKVALVAQVMGDVLPCYAQPRRVEGCRPTEHSLDAIFIEGHTDSDQMSGYGPISDNMDLSALRATNTFRAMRQAAPMLEGLKNRNDRPILSVSGYGADRPVADGDSEAAKRQNRRIDLRFLMESPRNEDLSTMLTSGS